MFRALLCLICVSLLAAPTLAQEKRVALSFDDIPRAAGAFMTPEERSRKLLAALQEAGVKQAVFFLNPCKLSETHGEGGEQRITAYVSAGHVIANHSCSHPKLSDTDTDIFLADIDRAASWLDGRKGYRAWFRFPYLDEGGDDKVKRDAIRAGLAKRGLSNGYVTADGSDWFLEVLTVKAKQDGREMDMGQLRRLYVASQMSALEYHDELAKLTLGRSPAHNLLLHETDLAALFIGDLVAEAKRRGWTIISADEAYADPINAATPDVPFAYGTLIGSMAWEKDIYPPLSPTWMKPAMTRFIFENQVIQEAKAEPATIPERYRGVWDYVGGTCAPESDMRLAIEPGQITFYESIGKVTGIVREGEDDTVVAMAMNGEGEQWTESRRLSLVEQGGMILLYTSDGEKERVIDKYPRKRCES